VIIKKLENTNTDIYDDTSHEECHTKGSKKEIKIKYKSLFTYRDKTNVEREMYY
jgi:hypothetical protein